MTVDSVQSVPLNDAPPDGVESVPVRPPSFGEVLSSVVQQPGLSFIAAGGGALRGAGDLVGSRTLQQLGGEIYKNASGAAQDITPTGMDLGQQVLYGGIQSIGETFPYLAAAALTGGGATPAILAAGATTAGQKYGELRQENFSGGRAAFHAGIDGIAESLGEYIGLPVLFKGGQPFMKMLGEFMRKELVGEEFTTIAQQANAMLSNQPNMTWGEFLDGIKMTALVTPVAAVGQAGIVRGLERMRPGSAHVPGHSLPEGGPEVAPIAEPPQVVPAVPAMPGVETLPLAPTAPTALPPGVEEFKLTPGTAEPVAEPIAATPQEPDTQTAPMFAPERGPTWRDNSPEMMIEQGKVDPQLYAGLPTKDGGSLNIMFDERLGWSIISPDGAGGIKSEYFMNADSLLDRAKQLTGVDLLQDRQLLNRLHLGNLIHDAQTGNNLSNVNAQYYGQQARDLFDSYKIIEKDAPRDPLVSQWMNTYTRGSQQAAEFLGYANRATGVSPATIQPLNGTATEVDVAQLHQVEGPAGTYIMEPSPGSFGETVYKLRGLDTTRALAKRVEAWRQEFSPDMKVIIAPSLNSAHDLNNGAMFRLKDGSFLLTYNPSRKGAGPYTTMSHEFGHALIMKELLDSPPQVALRFINDWMQVRSKGTHAENVAKFGGVGRYGMLNRIQSPADQIEGDWSRYQMGFDEYMADQVAQFLYDHQRTFGPEEKNFLRAVAERLKSFYERIAHKFQRAPGFTDWMNSLRGEQGSKNPLPEHPVEPMLVPEKPKKAQAKPKNRLKIDLDDLDFTKLPVTDEYDWKFRESFGGTEVHELFLGDRIYTVVRTGASGKLEYTLETSVVDNQKATEEVLGIFTAWPAIEAEVSEHQKQIQKQLTVGNRDQEDLDTKIRRALRKYGYVGEGILNRIDSQGSLNRELAWEFLELMGEDTSKYMDSTVRNDDTTVFRGALSKLGVKFPELGPHIGRTNEATKSFNWFFQKTLTAVQLRKRYGEQIPGAKLFVDLLEKMHAYKSRWKSMADDRIKEMRGLNKKERNAVFQLLLQEDETGAFVSETKRITEPDGTVKHIRVLSEAVAKQFGLTEHGARLYTNLVEDFRNALHELEELAKQELYRTYAGDTEESKRALHDAISKMEVEFAQMRSKPYVPHTRFGEYTVTVLDGAKVSEFYQFESEKDAKNLAERLRKQGKIASAGRMREDIRSFIGLPSALIQSMKTSLNLTAEQMKEFEDLMKNLSSGQAFVRRMKERKGIPGYENDAEMYPRVYADYFSRFSNHAARLKFNHQLNDSESQVRAQIKDNMAGAEDSVNLANVLNWMQRTHEWAVAPRSEFASIRAAVTLWYLGFNVKSAFVNAMSVPMVTAPYLSTRFGWAKASSGISGAYRDLARQYTKANVLTQDELKVLANLREMGIVDESFSAELAGIREGGTLSDLTSMGTLQGNQYRLKYYGMYMFHKMELVNRYATALAAYRLARNTKDFAPTDLDGFDKQARDFAKAAVQDTQNENAQWNRAEMMRGGKSVLTMFMSYQQNVIYQMFGGDSSWVRMLAVQLTLAGLMGLPFAKDLDNLTKWFARKVLGDDSSIDKAVRAYLQDTLINPDVLLKGASYNVFGADLQGSLSLGQVIPGLDALAMEGNFPDRLANAAGDVGGAGASVMLEFMKAVASNDPSGINRFTRALPTAFKNAKQGYDMLTTGSVQNSQGDTVAEATQADSIMKMLGVQPTAVTEETSLRFVQKDAAKFWLTRREYVIAKYYRAVQNQDADAISQAREDLVSFNEEVPSASLRLDAKTLRESLIKRLKGDVMTEHDLPTQKNMRDLYSQQAALYGR